GFAGATIAAVAQQAGVAPGLIHHHFQDKQDLLAALLQELSARFRARIESYEGGGDPLLAYADAALKLDERSDIAAARCWVGVLAEAIRNPTLFAQVKRVLDGELEAIRRRAGGRLTEQQAGAVLAFIVGSLVFGAFAPRRTAGFATPGLRQLLAALR